VSPRTAGRRCPGCPHAAHRDECRGKGPSGCVPLDGGGMACYRGQRPPCPCPFGWCHDCRAVICGATPDGEDFEVDFDYVPPAAVLDGTWAVRRRADTTLACRPLAPGEQPAAGEWRGRAHAHQLAEAAR
jgi:hypothetical protein